MASHGNPNDPPALPTTTGSRLCSRCGGLLVTEYYMDLQDDTGQINFTALRCAMCGNVTDAVILKNRHSPPPNLLYGTKARKFSQQVKRLDAGQDRKGSGGNGAGQTPQ